jgi:hypothetical protein
VLHESRLLRAAIAAAERGWPVFPLVPYGKRPVLVRWQQQASRDPHVLAFWWRDAPYNIGIACEPARLLVVDLDQPAGEEAHGREVFLGLAPEPLAPTYRIATPAGGEHRYYSVDEPAPSTVGRLGRYVDTRGAGGYVVGAGSVRRTAAGRRYYRLLDPTPPIPAPGWLLDLLATPPASAVLLPRSQARRSAYAQAALVGELALIGEAQPGTRNAVLFHAAVKLGTLVAADVLDEHDVREQLHGAAAVHVGHHGFTTAEAERAIANGLRYGQQHPRQFTDG